MVSPRQLNCGMAMFTLLDGGLAPSEPGWYPSRRRIGSQPGSPGGPKLFGQGAELYVERFKVQSCRPQE